MNFSTSFKTSIDEIKTQPVLGNVQRLQKRIFSLIKYNNS